MKKTIAVLKNAHSRKEMDEIAERIFARGGPGMTVAETLAYAAELAKQRNVQPSTKATSAETAGSTVPEDER